MCQEHPWPPRDHIRPVAVPLPPTTQRLPLWPLVFVLLLFTGAASALTVGLSQSDAVVLGGIRTATQESSANWAGYVALDGQMRNVTATWRVPAVARGSGSDATMSVWVGLNGRGDRHLEQVGTASGFTNGQVRYQAWWEILPHPAAATGMRVSPGDLVTAAVSTDGTGMFVLSLRDLTTGGHFSTTQWDRGARLRSAEAVVEAPTGPHGLLPLPDFGTVRLQNVAVDGLSIFGHSWSRVVMHPDDDTTVVTSPLAADGRSFSVTYRAPRSPTTALP